LHLSLERVGVDLRTKDYNLPVVEACSGLAGCSGGRYPAGVSKTMVSFQPSGGGSFKK
jgi:hypothetical protein